MSWERSAKAASLNGEWEVLSPGALSWGLGWAGQAEKQQNFLVSHGCCFSLPSFQLGPSEPQSPGSWGSFSCFVVSAPSSLHSPPEKKAVLKNHWKNKVHWEKKCVPSKPRGNNKIKPKLQECQQLVFPPLGKVQSQLHAPRCSGCSSRELFLGAELLPTPVLPSPSKPCWGSMTRVLPEGKAVQGSRNKFPFFSQVPPPSQSTQGCDFSSPSGSSQMLPHLTAGYEWWAAKNRGLLVLWWIEFDAGIMATNVPGNIAFHFCGFWEHGDDHLLLADWKPQLRGPQKHFSPGYFLSNSLPWYL